MNSPIPQEIMQEMNKIANEVLYGESEERKKGTSTYYYFGSIKNKSVCYTLARTYFKGRFGFWSWIQTKYKNGTTKRTKFAKSGSKIKAHARAERLFKELKNSETIIESNKDEVIE